MRLIYRLREKIMNSKCEMARLRYCRKSSMGYCNAEDRDLETCPYLKAIGEIAKLVAENGKYEDIETPFIVKANDKDLIL